jgi:hypothetical protein
MRVYLGGPVDPAALELCLRWRLEATAMLAERGLTAVNPCRDGRHPKQRADGRITGLPVTPSELVARDKADIRSCQAVLVCWPAETRKRGIGTTMEIALAGEWSIPVLLVDPGGQIADHPWVQVYVAERHPSLDAAVEALATRL